MPKELLLADGSLSERHGSEPPLLRGPRSVRSATSRATARHQGLGRARLLLRRP